MPKTKNMNAFVLVILAMVLYGTNAVALKYASQSMDPIAYAALRSLFIGAILLVFVKTVSKIISVKIILKLLPGVMMIAAFFALNALGVSESGALKASILSLTIPVYVYIYAVTLLHEPVIKRILFGGILTLIGSILLVGLPILFGYSLLLSDLLLLASYAFIAGAIVHGKYTFKWLTTNEMLSMRFFLSGIVLSSYVLIFMGPETFTIGDGGAWLVLLYAITISGIIGNTLYYRGLSKLKAEQTAPLLYLDPMTGTLLATLLLGEQLELIAAFGVVIIITGVFISYPHHHHVLFNYLHPSKDHIRRILHRVIHPLRG